MALAPDILIDPFRASSSGSEREGSSLSDTRRIRFAVAMNPHRSRRKAIARMGLQSTGEKDQHLTITRQTEDVCHPKDTSTVRMRLILKGSAGKISTRCPVSWARTWSSWPVQGCPASMEFTLMETHG